jgi:uncharacterized protein YxjI
MATIVSDLERQLAAGPRTGSTCAARYRMRHQPGERGGRWVVADEADGEELFTVSRRPFGGHRMAVRDAEGQEHGSVGERVMSLVENYTLWRGGRPYARVYRPIARGRPERWLVEVGEDDLLTARVDVKAATFRLLRAGRDVAAVVARGDGARAVEVAPGEDAGLVLALAAMLGGLEERL